MAMESFADHKSSFVSGSCFTALSRSDTFLSASLVGLFRSVLNTVSAEEARQGKEAGHLWNPIIKKGSKVEDHRLQQSSVVRYLRTNQLLMHHLAKDTERLLLGKQRAIMEVWIGWLLALWDLEERESHLLWLLGTARRFSCEEEMFGCSKLATTTLSLTKTSRLPSLPLSMSWNLVSCTHLRGHTVLRSAVIMRKKGLSGH